MNFTKISIIIKDKPPYFIGSQLRGAFGYALKKVTCINPSFECQGCFATSNCLYYEFYEEKNSFHKYRFDFLLGKRYYDFSLFLFGESVPRMPYVISALHMMLTQTGLGKERKKYSQFEMYINGKNCMREGRITIPSMYQHTFETPPTKNNIILRLETPLRIKKNNKYANSKELELSNIVNSIYQRQMQLTKRGYKKFPYEIEGTIENRELSYKELVRYSNRQKSHMKLGGLVGEMHIYGIDENSYHVLKLGELIGTGKQTVFGLGKIKVEDIL